MMLRSKKGMPPGGIIFVDPRQPSMQWLDDHTFLTERVQQVIQWRARNPNVYDRSKDAAAFDPQSVTIEISDFNCKRLPAEYCFDHVTGVAPAAPSPSLCVCGATMTPIYCKTCGSPQITSWTCGSCGRTK